MGVNRVTIPESVRVPCDSYFNVKRVHENSFLRIQVRRASDEHVGGTRNNGNQYFRLPWRSHKVRFKNPGVGWQYLRESPMSVDGR